MGLKDVYLKIERIDAYGPVQPMEKVVPPLQYGRDCMRNVGHADGFIPAAEIEARMLNALVYREYEDLGYLLPVTDKLIPADVNEPIYDRRISGALLYANPGDQLHIHVFNVDVVEHSFHIHGLDYGIDSDGAWPLGVQTADKRRSDAICPGDHWTYILDVTDEMLGVWPFHDHGPHASASIARGLFGGLIVRKDKIKRPTLTRPHDIRELLDDIQKLHRRPLRVDALPAPSRHLPKSMLEWLNEWTIGEIGRPPKEEVIEAPIFFHHLADPTGTPLFDSGDLEEGGVGTFQHTFNDAGTFEYFCSIQAEMEGTIQVDPAAPDIDVTVAIKDADPATASPSISICSSD